MVGQGDHDDRGGSGGPYGHHDSLFCSVVPMLVERSFLPCSEHN